MVTATADFMYGHIKVELGIAFGLAPFPFSDGAILISGYGEERIFNKDWLDLFEPTSVKEQTELIVRGSR
jgi:D-apionate oxidoisomerase